MECCACTHRACKGTSHDGGHDIPGRAAREFCCAGMASVLHVTKRCKKRHQCTKPTPYPAVHACASTNTSSTQASRNCRVMWGNVWVDVASAGNQCEGLFTHTRSANATTVPSARGLILMLLGAISPCAKLARSRPLLFASLLTHTRHPALAAFPARIFAFTYV